MDVIDCTELEMFDACLVWAKRACEVKGKNPPIIANVREELDDCLFAIQFGAMESEEIKHCISQNKELFTQSEIEDLELAIGSDKSKLRIFKKIVPRWESGRRIIYSPHNRSYSYSEVEIRRLHHEFISFKINKPILLARISVGEIVKVPTGGNCYVTLFVLGGNSGKTELLGNEI